MSSADKISSFSSSSSVFILQFFFSFLRFLLLNRSTGPGSHSGAFCLNDLYNSAGVYIRDRLAQAAKTVVSFMI